MNAQKQADWDPTSPEVTRDQRAAYDEMREKQPIAFSTTFGWSVFRHQDVVHVLRQHETFSSIVSRHLSVPNGMDPPAHTQYRRLIEPYFAPDRIQAFAPQCQEIAAQLTGIAVEKRQVELMSDLGRPFAAQIQCAFLGWPRKLADELGMWMVENQLATQAQDRTALSRLASDFEAMIDSQLAERRTNASSIPDVTAQLMAEQVQGRGLDRSEIASILRNWTGGEVGTIAAAIGITVDFLANHVELQNQLRAEPHLLSHAIDEILRIDGPLATNRRVTTKPVEIAGRNIAAGERLTLMWISANRDPRAFFEPEMFRWDRDPRKNLLYGEGIHICPGAPLARLELSTVMEELLRRTKSIRPVVDRPSRRAVYPAAGFSEVFVEMT